MGHTLVDITALDPTLIDTITTLILRLSQGTIVHIILGIEVTVLLGTPRVFMILIGVLEWDTTRSIMVPRIPTGDIKLA